MILGVAVVEGGSQQSIIYLQSCVKVCSKMEKSVELSQDMTRIASTHSTNKM